MNEKMSFEDMPPSTRIVVFVGVVLIGFGVCNFGMALIPTNVWNELIAFFSSVARFVWPMVLIIAGFFILWAVKKGKFDGFVERQTHGEFRRSRTDQRLAGVCGGIAYYFGVDSTMVRIMVVILTALFPLFVFVAYMVMIFLVPKE